MISSIFFLLSIFLPPHVEVESYATSSSLQFRIVSEDDLIGIVHRKKFCNSYEFANSERDLQAVAILESKGPSGKVFQVTDKDGGFLGTIDENLTHFLPEYRLISPKNVILAVGEVNVWNTNIVIYEPETRLVLAELSRPFIRTYGDWSAKIYCQESLEPLLFIPLLAILSD